jgi:hypothetical protein
LLTLSQSSMLNNVNTTNENIDDDADDDFSVGATIESYFDAQ